MKQFLNQVWEDIGKKLASHKMPQFWYKNSPALSILPELLLPFTVIYHFANVIRKRNIVPEKIDVPVICIGNVTVGGAGKTPIAIEIAKFLKESGKNVHFISRGYLGSQQEPVKVVPIEHTAKSVGDEPLLLARIAPCWVGKDRLATAKAAINDGAEIIVMDDGLQNPFLKKDVSFIVIDGGFGIGNGMTVPSGPLREPLHTSLKAANAVIFIGQDKTDCISIIKKYNNNIIFGVTKPDAARVKEINESKSKYIAFAGIGRPEKFFETLAEIGLKEFETHSFPDHYNYTEEDIEEMKKFAKAGNAKLITTEKDFVRLSKDLQKDIEYLPITIEFDEVEKVKSLISSF